MHRGADGTREDSPKPVVLLHVHNDQFADVRVYILRGSSRIALGAVAGFERRTFRVNASLLPAQGGVRFLADPLAHEIDAVSPAIAVVPGQTVEWRISFTPTLSSLIVR
jgi:hypothetical protein